MALALILTVGGAWVDSANLDEHWAYIKPLRPAIPQTRASGWGRNPIDSFVLSRLEREGLSPAAEADRYKLLRRASLDLTGLPPTPEEIESFIGDKRPDAYERVIDRLLESPHFGERWARMWLDLARYADSNGYEKDSLRVMWKYRDWVINAFNRDLGFDRFTIEQLAGDMLPGATQDQIIATGFHRNTMLNQEGGIDPDEARYEMLVDRTNTTATVWLGTTLACAQCHNHKYDPFSQKDYFRFYAYFEGSEYEIAHSVAGDQNSRFVKEPELSLATPEQDARRDQIEAELKQIEATLKRQTPALDQAQSEWEQNLHRQALQWQALETVNAQSTAGSILMPLPDQSIRVDGEGSDVEQYVITMRTRLRRVAGLRLEALADPGLPQGGPGRDPYGNFLLTGISIETGDGTKVQIREVRVNDSAYRFESERFLRAAATGQALDAPHGWYVNATRDQTRLNREAVIEFVRPLPVSRSSTLKVTLKFEGGAIRQGLGRFRLSAAEAADAMNTISVPARLAPVMSIDGAARTEKQKEEISALFRSITPLLREQRTRASKLRDELKDLGIATALVLRERQPREAPRTLLRERGNFMSPGEELSAGVPVYISKLPAGKVANRLTLAEWIVDRNNPLTARVTVNRFWEQIFGRGLVETSEDFGLQSSPPSHPELLDWLAVEFMERGWSVKHLLRLITTSSAYRQSSAVSKELLERDPYNRLLARGPRFRVEAEMVRDAALAASGLLSRKVGGPSVFPPQPDGIWRNPYSGARWITSRGEDRYRRSIYTFIRRTSPYPSMVTFDATSREYCTVRRVRTNTPLQALTTLNDEAFFELARNLARRILKEGGTGNQARISFGMTLAASRPARSDEIAVLERLLESERARFLGNPESAVKVLGDLDKKGAARVRAELAAWTIVGNVLLNLDEALTKE
ncbi:MAG: DUF1553 domain-containing protein [Blastocatellales bacterium]|nr:DUF1553 domain-containing protein [Blastocatellales bacterium]